MIVKNGEDIIQSIYKEAYETEHHLHNDERWIGNGAVEASLTGYTLVSGNAAFGAEALLLDVANTPIHTGMLKFDIHRIFVTALTSATPYIVRLLYGTGTVGDAEAAGQYTDIPIVSSGSGSNLKGSPSDVINKRINVGTKVWGKCKNATNLASIAILLGIHEYVQ